VDCQYNRRLVLACGLATIPCRRTFDRRLKTISTDIKERISTMGRLFVTNGLGNLSITAIDSTLLKAKGHTWHKSMKKGMVPCPGMDTEMHDGATVTQKDGFRIQTTSYIISSSNNNIINSRRRRKRDHSTSITAEMYNYC
jgi:hypothetical protein